MKNRQAQLPNATALYKACPRDTVDSEFKLVSVLSLPRNSRLCEEAR